MPGLRTENTNAHVCKGKPRGRGKKLRTSFSVRLGGNHPECLTCGGSGTCSGV